VPAAFTEALLDARNVAKSFGAVRALTDASLTVRRGEVVALMGANGAGKSTFVKILTGAIRPDAGRVTIRGAEARVGSPAEARRSGLVPVYQEPSLIPDLDVADNLRLGDTDAETFQHWTAELGHPELRLDAMIRDLPLGHAADHRPRPRAGQHARRAAAGRIDRRACPPTSWNACCGSPGSRPRTGAA
jgi:ABC-type sugar transport system ATPase subunit